MSETKLIVNDRLKMTMSDKKGQKFVSIGLEKDIPEGMDITLVADDAYMKLSEMLKEKMDAMPEPPAAPAYQPRYNKPAAPASGQNCNKCGADMIVGRNGKPYCKPCYISWKKSQEEQAQQPQQPTYGGADTTYGEDIPF